MPNRLANLLGGAMLLLMALFSVSSVADDSATFDELAHIPAGYSYLTQGEMRLNFEHPPLIKDLAALPLLFLNLNFPEKSIYWNQMLNTSFEFGDEFLYYANRNPDQILFFARLPMIFILLVFGFFLFWLTKKMGGNKFGLGVLALYAFSPEFLAHGRLVTTDVGASAAIFIAIYCFLKFLKGPSKKSVILASLTLSIALLTKFSAIILVPVFILILAIWALVFKNKVGKKGITERVLCLLLIFFISLILVGIIYQFHLINLPSKAQANYTKIILFHPLLKTFGGLKWLINLCVGMAGNTIFRPYALYLLGLLIMTVKTVWGFGVSGIPTYFLGEISTKGHWYYFPVVYFIKLPLAFHIMSLIAVFYSAKALLQKKVKKVRSLISENFTGFSMMIFVIIYVSVMISGNINLGIRHLLPILPFLYIFSLWGIRNWISGSSKMVLLKKGIIGLLFFWYIFSSISAFPFFLTHFNELAGGPSGGSRYVVDSNLDWGQDLKRLKTWVEENNIEKIKIDYFGGGNVEYYFGEKYEKFDSKSGPQKGWLAISATSLRRGQGKSAPDFEGPAGYYNRLNLLKPMAVIGNSIFVYYIQ